MLEFRVTLCTSELKRRHLYNARRSVNCLKETITDVVMQPMCASLSGFEHASLVEFVSKPIKSLLGYGDIYSNSDLANGASMSDSLAINTPPSEIMGSG